MRQLYIFSSFIFFVFVSNLVAAQTTDSIQNVTNFSGSVGITNNGFSIIPAFSLNSPAVIANFSWRKKRFSFDPDIRLVPNASKGGILLWLRYRLIEKKQFSLRVGVHPAFTLVRRTIVENAQNIEITEMLRFGAFEIVPSYQISKKFRVSATYLQGHGFQQWGPQLTNVLFLNTAITTLNLGKTLQFDIYPSIFFLHTDGYRGDFLTLTGVLTHRKLPFSLQSTINQTLKSDIPNNQNFMWNVVLNYNFKGEYRKNN